MSPPPPARLLFLRPDTYGDLLIFEPVTRIIRDAWPDTEIAILIREPYADVAPLFAADGLRWLTTPCHPYREGPAARPAALEDLRATVQAFAPDCVVAACANQTWLEAAVAAFSPGARQVSLGDGLTDPLLRGALDAVLPVPWSQIYPEKIPLLPARSDWEQNLRLASALLGHEAPRWPPAARVPAAAAAAAARILADAGLAAGEFVVCLAAGTANVQIKSWPAENYGDTLAWLERTHGVRALLVGHVSERAHLETVRQTARGAGGNPALWTGRDGEMPVVAGLLATSRFCFGNDTGALHLAAALDKGVASIFGGGHWPRFEPVARRALTVVQPLPCFGCAWDCYFVDAPCVRTISPASVRQALEEFLQESPDRRTIFHAHGLDAGARTLIETATPRLRFLQEDRAARARQIAQLTAWITDGLPSAGPTPAASPVAQDKPRHASLLTQPVRYHLDACGTQGENLIVSGWAFRPDPQWDSRVTTVTLLFRDGATVYRAGTTRVPRPDVAAHFAKEGAATAGGARGLVGAGFVCEILRSSLPAGVNLQLALRLECGDLACEQPTDQIVPER